MAVSSRNPRPPFGSATALGDVSAADGGEHGGAAVIQALAGVQDDFVGRRFAALRIDELARLRGKGDADAAVLANGMLNHHDGVGAKGNGRASHDLDCLARTHYAREALPGADFANHLELARQVDGAHRIPIANRAGQRGDVAVGSDIFGQHASGGGFQTHFFGGGCRARGAYGGEDGLAGLVECQGRHSFYYDR